MTAVAGRPSQWLFVKERWSWPRAAGHDVHGPNLAKALAARGHEVWAGTFLPSPPEALSGLGLAGVVDLATVPPTDPSVLVPATRLQRKFEGYWGTDPARQLALATAVGVGRYDAVVVLAADGLPWFRAVPAGGPVRVWYAADDLALHSLSFVRPADPRTWGRLRTAATQGLYERAFAGLVDRVWVVSGPDRRAMRLATGGVPVDVVPNGVDADSWRPPDPPPGELPESCVFWGRLDFGPNEDAVGWFVENAWPHVRAACPAARFDVFGFSPSRRVKDLCRAPGVSLTVGLPDLRAEVCRRAVVVLPFVSGRGIKNKLLEAAALGRPIAGTPLALTGARGRPPVVTAAGPRQLAAAVVNLFRDPGRRADLGRRARAWVTSEHSWDAAARTAEAGMARGGRA